MRASSSAQAFNNVPNHDYLKFFEKSKLEPKRVVDFLKFDQTDVAKATTLPKSSIRYDERIPEELEQRLTEIAVICELVAGYFKGDVQKTALWFQLPNPQLGNIAPREMIRYERYKKLLRFVQSALSGISP